jgi:hypothetical protein
MKHSFAIALAFAAPLSVLAQTTVFSDNFATDVSNPSLSYLNAGSAMTWANGTGISISSTATGQLTDLIGAFTSQSLANAGDSLSFVVNFNSPNIGTAGTSGSLLFALDNSLGTPLLGNGNTQSESSSATGGTTANDLGYLGMIGFNTTPKTGSKFYARQGGPNNNLSYYSNVSQKTQISTTVANANNAVLQNGHAFTLTYTLTALNAGASQMQITASIYDDTLGTMQDNFSFGATNGAAYITPTTTYDTFDVGLYSGSIAAYTLNLTSASVIVTPAPEPSVLALTGVGLIGLVARFRRVRG